MIRPSVAFALLLTAGCGSKTFASLCDIVPAPEACQTACDPSPAAPSSCPAGYFCAADGQCDIQCTINGGQCGDGYACTEEGRCVDDSEAPQNGPDANCPAVNFTPMPVTPSIQLVLDQSGSMFPNQSMRYAQMREALVNTNDGVVTSLASKAYFGSLLYTCTAGNANNDFTVVPRALNNADAIRTSVDGKTGGNNTPTPAALDAAVESFRASPPPAGSPPVIVLATDGIPNSCPGSGSTRNESVAAARRAYEAGIPVYVLAIDIEDDHFTDLANAGGGRQPGQPNIPYYRSSNATQLKAAFDTIIKGVISCDLALTSSIDEAQASTGVVTVNGNTLTYGSDWTLVNGNVIRLLGGACDALKVANNPSVNASFPCGSVIF